MLLSGRVLLIPIAPPPTKISPLRQQNTAISLIDIQISQAKF